MKYLVEGADAHSGKARVEVIDAPDERYAEDTARGMGIYTAVVRRARDLPYWRRLPLLMTGRWRRRVAISIGILLASTMMLVVWPTPYRYDNSSGQLVRINRVTGKAARLTAEGWKAMEPALPKPQPKPKSPPPHEPPQPQRYAIPIADFPKFSASSEKFSTKSAYFNSLVRVSAHNGSNETILGVWGIVVTPDKRRFKQLGDMDWTIEAQSDAATVLRLNNYPLDTESCEFIVTHVIVMRMPPGSQAP